ncbi:MAG: glycosyltransferase family 4 protein [Acidimicrobiales bacterium]
MAEEARLRIVLVAHEVHDEGGMERSFAALVRHLHDRYQVVVVARRLAPDLRPLAKWKRVRVPGRPGALTQVAFFVIAGAMLWRESADVIHTMGAVVPNRAGLRSVHFCHAGYRQKAGSLAPKGPPSWRRLNRAIARLLALWAERWCYQPGRTSLLAAVSRGLEVELHQHYPRMDVRVTPNGVKVELFQLRPEIRQEMRAYLGVSKDAIVVLFAGGEWDRKGLDVAIKALAVARARGTKSAARLRLCVVGRGDEARFSRLAADLGVAAHVSFLGFQSNVDRYYQAADIFLLPTLYETFSLVAHEAAACELPVVATPVSGIDELVGDNQAGIVVDRDPAVIADALTTLADDPDLRRRLGTEARRRCIQLTWENSTQAVDEIYRELMGTDLAPLDTSSGQPSRMNESMERGHTESAGM